MAKLVVKHLYVDNLLKICDKQLGRDLLRTLGTGISSAPTTHALSGSKYYAWAAQFINGWLVCLSLSILAKRSISRKALFLNWR